MAIPPLPSPLNTPLGSTLRHRENLASIKLGQIFMHFYLIKGIESSVELRPSTFITRIGAAQVNSRTDYVLYPFTQGGTAPPPSLVFLSFTQNIFRQPIPENSGPNKTFYSGCSYVFFYLEVPPLRAL